MLYVIVYTLVMSLQDEKNQVLTTRAWLNINWMDRRLSWDMEHYDNITTIYAPHYRLWKPDIMLTNKCVELKTLKERLFVLFQRRSQPQRRRNVYGRGNSK